MRNREGKMKYKTVKRMRHVGMCRCEVKIDQLCNQHSLSAKHIFASSISFHSDCQWVSLVFSLSYTLMVTRTDLPFICHLRKKPWYRLNKIVNFFNERHQFASLEGIEDHVILESDENCMTSNYLLQNILFVELK